MRVAVVSLTRDRLPYTQTCFGKLRELAGCPFDHFVLDNGSTDGTKEWLSEEFDAKRIDIFFNEPGNLGVSRGINRLLDCVASIQSKLNYDVIVKVDNDLELTVPGTLKAACEVADRACAIVSPHIQGLDHPPTIERETWSDGYRIGIPNIMGGIFMAAPASLYETYRHDENNPIWGMDDAKIVDHWRALGGEVGYLLDYPANHYLSTAGQRADNVGGYYDRKTKEFTA